MSVPGEAEAGSDGARQRLGVGAPASILVVKPSSFGDVIHTLPAVVRLKQAWPSAHLAWVVNTEWMPLLAGNPFVDEVIEFPRAAFRGLRGATGFLRWCRKVIGVRRPDLAVDFQGLLRSAWIAHSSRAHHKVGMSDAREGARWIYDEVIPMPAGVPHAVERYLTTVEGLLTRAATRAESGGHDTVEPMVPGSRQPPPEKVLQQREACAQAPIFPLPAGEPLDAGHSSLPERFVLLHPFSRGQGKSLSTAQIQSLSRCLLPERVVLVGRCAPDQQPPWPENCVDLLNSTSLAQLIWLIRRAAAVITVDSGPSHLAAALGRPMVAIHTWSDPRRVGPYRDNAWIWKNDRLLQFHQLRGLDEAFFRGAPTGLRDDDLEAIARLATSFSDFSE